MTEVYDAIVLGLGGMGSAAAYHLARRGKKVLGIEQFSPAHDRGSSHGESRIIRQAYFEGEEYVPLLLRSYELWNDLERDSDQKLVHLTGALMLGAEDSELVQGSLRSAITHGLPHELLGSDEIKRRFPAFDPPPETVALYEKNAGYVVPELAVEAHLDLAGKHGAELRFGEKVVVWEASETRVKVTTGNRTYEAERLVVTAGAWASEILSGLELPLAVERRVMHWFEPTGSASGVGRDDASRFPVFVWSEAGKDVFYGIPDGHPDSPLAVKAAFHYVGDECSPDTLDRDVKPGEIEAVRQVLDTYMPEIAGRHVASKACMYTNTPDLDFVVSVHPELSRVCIAAGFSGHGFKFCPVVGEILADLAIKGDTTHPLRLFSTTRFDDPEDIETGKR